MTTGVESETVTENNNAAINTFNSNSRKQYVVRTGEW